MKGSQSPSLQRDNLGQQTPLTTHVHLSLIRESDSSKGKNTAKNCNLDAPIRPWNHCIHRGAGNLGQGILYVTVQVANAITIEKATVTMVTMAQINLDFTTLTS